MNLILLVSFLFVIQAGCAPEPAKLAFVGGVSAPKSIVLGEWAELRVQVRNTGNIKSTGQVRLRQKATLDWRTITLNAGAQENVVFRVRPQSAGVYHYSIDLRTDGQTVAAHDIDLQVEGAGAADLVWRSAVFSAEPILNGYSHPIRIEMANRGGRASGGLVMVLSHGQQVGSFRVAPVAPGASQFQSAWPVLDAFDGGLSLVLLADDLEEDPAGNVIKLGEIASREPGWLVGFPSIISGFANAPLPVSFQVSNNGADYLPARKIDLYFSENSVFDSQADLPVLQRIEVPGLNMGETVDLVAHVPLWLLSWPWNAAGNYSIIARIDDERGLGRSFAGEVQIAWLAPDLVPEPSISADFVSAPGETVLIGAAVTNSGPADSGPFWLAITLPSAGGVELGRVRVLSLQAGASVNTVVTALVPSLTDAAYRMRVKIDADSEIFEQNENNNSGNLPQSILVKSAGDGVVLIQSYAPASVPATAPVTLQVRWENHGYAALDATLAYIHLLKAGENEHAGYVTTVVLPALAAHAQILQDFAVTPMRGGGTYAWFVTATPLASEIFAGNNFARSDAGQVITSGLGLTWLQSITDATMSSPAWVDVDQDSILDTIIGTGTEDIYGNVVALSGIDGRELWRVVQGDEVISSAAVTGSGSSARIFIGGREGYLYAIRATDGSVVWRHFLNHWVETPALADVDGDGQVDVVVTAGGGGSQFGGVLVVLDSVTGAEKYRLNDAFYEFYASPAVGDITGDGVPEIVFGAGGELQHGTDTGYIRALTRTSTSPLLYATLWSQATVTNGVESSPLLIDLNADGVTDVVTSGMEGFVAAYKGQDGVMLWKKYYPGFEFFASPGAGDITGGAGPEIVVAGNLGAWPYYSLTRLLVFDGGTGDELWRFDYGNWGGGASPLVLDLLGDSKAEIVASFPAWVRPGDMMPGRYNVFVLDGGGGVRDVFDADGFSISTPALVDSDGDGYLNLLLGSYADPLSANLSTPYPVTGGKAWSKFRGNLQNTGRY